MTTTKRIAILLALAAFAAAFSVGAAAQCSPGKPVANVLGWQNFGAAGGLGTTLLTRFWQTGASNTANSGTMASAQATAYSTGYYITSDWGNSGAVGCPCPGGVCGTSTTAFLYSRANAGTAQYLVLTAGFSSNRFNFDAVTNGALGNVTTAADLVPLPALTVTNSVLRGDGAYDVTVTWTPLTQAQRLGKYDVAPTNNVVTGIALYYYTGATPFAGNYNLASWTLAQTAVAPARTGYVTFAGPAATTPDPGTATVTIPAVLAPNRTWLAASVLFDGATPGQFAQTQFVGALSNPFAPTASSLFNGVSAQLSGDGSVDVSWVSGTETRVTSYQVYWAPNVTNVFKAVGSPIAAVGSNNFYSTNVRVLTTARSYYVKVRASKSDGTFEWSVPVQVTLPGKLAPSSPRGTGLRK